MRVAWTAMAVTSGARFTADQDGMLAVNAAVAALAGDPEPPEAFIRGDYRRLHVGDYRVMYGIEGDVVTVIRVDRVN